MRDKMKALLPVKLWFLSCWLLAGLASGKSPDALPSRVEFNRDVRPLLSDRCFACHGPDKNARKAKLRLDLREEAVKSAIVPGDVARSPLVQHITAHDPEEV